ncbi:hypothetical protein K439DRAFT_1622980 [Ramaria rubella]|nr:hypothetical protein K439DRAFT_1622980 [Ramaria rubella]
MLGLYPVVLASIMIGATVILLPKLRVSRLRAKSEVLMTQMTFEGYLKTSNCAQRHKATHCLLHRRHFCEKPSLGRTVVLFVSVTGGMRRLHLILEHRGLCQERVYSRTRLCSRRRDRDCLTGGEAGGLTALATLSSIPSPTLPPGGEDGKSEN